MFVEIANSIVNIDYIREIYFNNVNMTVHVYFKDGTSDVYNLTEGMTVFKQERYDRRKKEIIDALTQTIR